MPRRPMLALIVLALPTAALALPMHTQAIQNAISKAHTTLSELKNPKRIGQAPVKRRRDKMALKLREIHFIQDVFNQKHLGATRNELEDGVETVQTTQGGTVKMKVLHDGTVHLIATRLDDVQAQVSFQTHFDETKGGKMQVFRRYLPGGVRTVGERTTDTIRKLTTEPNTDLLGFPLPSIPAR